MTSRQRLLCGLAASIRARGYQATTVADVVAHARMSRRTFYEVFASKEECLLALVHDNNTILEQRIVDAVDPSAPPVEQVRAAVTAWIDCVAGDAELNVRWIREFPVLGETAAALQRDITHTFVTLIGTLTDNDGWRSAGVSASRAKAVILFGGLRELVAAVTEEGGDLRDVVEPAVEAAVAILTSSPVSAAID
jgi:AcrR family transcriptional regulator